MNKHDSVTFIKSHQDLCLGYYLIKALRYEVTDLFNNSAACSIWYHGHPYM